MSSARDRILGNIRIALGRAEPCDKVRAAYDARFDNPKRNTVPSRAKEPHAALVERFCAEARLVGATVVQLDGPDDIAREVASYLRDKNLPARIRVAPALQGVTWDDAANVEIGYGKAEPTDTATLTRALAGVAETGTLLLTSGPQTPTTLNFLPDANIVVLTEDDVVGAYEDAWDRVRAKGATPRAVNFVTGPSRTADIAQELILGAHGPIDLHIIVLKRA
jgi:L-lactate dehydrogenase complex protein LldG